MLFDETPQGTRNAEIVDIFRLLFILTFQDAPRWMFVFGQTCFPRGASFFHINLFSDRFLVSQLENTNIGLKSIQESLDTSSSSGKLIFHIFGALAEFERNLIRERTQAGLEAARARGRIVNASS